MRALVLLSIIACGDNQAAPLPDAPAEYVQPRLVGVGDMGTTFDDNGFPTNLRAIYSEYTFEWRSNGQLAAATYQFTGFDFDHTVTFEPTYSNDRLVELTGQCTGCVGRTDTFEYDARGALTTWNKGPDASQTYTFDALGRVIAVDDRRGHDDIEYGDGPCPTKLMMLTGREEVPYDALGRLSDRFGITYNDDGFIEIFGGTGPAFQPLRYEPGEGRGLDLWPGHYDGGFVYGFPFRGELYRLDGSCEPSMTSQATILALALASF